MKFHDIKMSVKTGDSIPEPEGKVDILLPPLSSSKQESRSCRRKFLLQLLVVFPRICQQVASKLDNAIPRIGSQQQVNPSQISRKDTEKAIFVKYNV